MLLRARGVNRAACGSHAFFGCACTDDGRPALNILMKLMAIISVVFADFFLSINDGGGLISYYV